MRSLSNIISESKQAAHVPEIIGHLRKLMFFGTKLAPGPAQSQQQLSPRKSSLGKKEYVPADSASDVSDSDGSDREAVRLRIQALQLISTLSKTNFKAVFGEWKQLMPEHAASMAQVAKFEPKLSTVLLHDPNGRCRTAAAQTFSALVENSKIYLAQADDKKYEIRYYLQIFLEPNPPLFPFPIPYFI